MQRNALRSMQRKRNAEPSKALLTMGGKLGGEGEAAAAQVAMIVAAAKIAPVVMTAVTE